MGEVVAQTICSNLIQYNPGNWFNSAKFLDIEYQTYGWVWAKPKENEEHFYWELSSKNICIRVAFDKHTHLFLGINVFGIRVRHEFFDTVLTEERTVDYVVENFGKANFDPEFFKKYDNEIKVAFKKFNNAAKLIEL